jgi:predicted MFS family arabinose efflux permease
LLLVLGTAAALALEEVAAVSRWGAGATGALLTLCSVGGVVGGLLYGRRVWHTAASRRILALGAAAVAALALTAAAPLLPVAAVAMLTLGACLDMLLITAYLLVDQLFPEGARMEAGAWVNTAYNLGCALGSALAGTLLDSRGSLTVLVAAASAAGLGTLAAVADGRFSRRPPLRPSTRAEPTSGSGPGSGSGSPSGSAVHHGDLTEAEVLELIGE